MPAFVLDGSIALAAALPDERTSKALLLLERAADEEAAAPAIWPLEVANGLLQAQRKGRITEEFRRQRLADMSRLPVVIDGEGTKFAWSETSRLAAHHRLTTYGAAYLELAIRRGLPLATFDADLAAAAARESVSVL